MSLRRPGRGILVVLVLLVGACRTGSEDSAATTTTDPTAAQSSPTDSASATTSVPEFEGDPDSPFCQRLAEDEERPVLDPFAAGIDSRELELRLRALIVRFDALAPLAPPDIAPDVELVAAGLRSLDDSLQTHGHDLGVAAEAGADLSFLNAPEFADVAARVAAYRAQVCRT